jgi:hypothetical protein
VVVVADDLCGPQSFPVSSDQMVSGRTDPWEAILFEIARSLPKVAVTISQTTVMVVFAEGVNLIGKKPIMKVWSK